MKSSKKECYFAGAYTRLSQDDGDKAESDSIRNQKELIRNFQKSHSEIHIVEEYSDDGYSGVNFERPGFQKMITDIHEKKIDCIIVKDLSRFGRNYIETGKYIEQIFPALGVRFIAINDNYDSAEKRQPGDQIILPFKNLVNDAYSRDLSVKIRSNLNAKRQIGDYVGAFAPYGYKKAEDNKNQLTIDWPAAKVVRRIFQLRIEGKSNAVIADILNQEGIPCPYDYKRHSPDSRNFASGFHGNGEASWSFNAINRILTNEIYLGTMVQGKSTRPNYKIKKTVVIDQEKWIRVKNTHEAIISQRDFDIVQKLAGIDTRISTGEGEVYLFSGLVLCEKCGDTLIRRTVVRNHTRYTYYGCYDRKRTIKCKGVVIREDDLEQAVLTSIQKHIQTLLDIDKLLKHVDEMPLLKRETDALTELVASAKNELLRYQNLNESLYRDYLEGIVDQDEYLDLRNIYSTNEERLHKSIQELDRKKQQVLNKTSSYQRCIELFREFGNIQKLDRKTLVMLISHISVVSKKKIKICFTYELHRTVYIEENVLQEAMADFILVGLKLKISQKTEEKKSSRENTGGKRKTPSQSFHSKKKMLSDIYEAYAEGKIDKDTFLRKKENIREMFETEDVEAETKTAVVRTDLENLLEEVQSTADDSWLTREVLKVFVKEIWIFPESEMKIIWKPEWALEGAGKDSIGEKEK